MADGMLSQEEINALLQGGSIGSSEIEPAQESQAESADNQEVKKVTEIEISDFEKDALGEIGNISMGTAATTLSTLLRQRVAITTPEVEIIKPVQLKSRYPLPYVVAEVEYTAGIQGTNILVIKEIDACIIADLMMGGNGDVEPRSLTEMELSAVGEAMNQMMGSATTSLSTMFNERIDIAPPLLNQVDLGKENLQLFENEESLICIKFKMEVGDLIDSDIMQIIPSNAVKSMIDILMGSTLEEPSDYSIIEPEPQTQPEQRSAGPPSSPHQPNPASAMLPGVSRNQDYSEDINSGIKKGGQYAVQPVQFAPLRESEIISVPQNIGLIMDVPLDVTVELGKTKKTIGEILELSQGAIIQLDKLAGEAVDLMVNGKLIAKGEVVVIDESYGIRITTIISPVDRMSKLQ